MRCSVSSFDKNFSSHVSHNCTMAEFLLDFFKLLKWSNKPLRLELSSFLSTKISAVSRTMEDFFIFLIGKIVSNKPLGLGLETPA